VPVTEIAALSLRPLGPTLGVSDESACSLRFGTAS
jgi:hypothetical protein